jgi:hypothetical protein
VLLDGGLRLIRLGQLHDDDGGCSGALGVFPVDLGALADQFHDDGALLCFLMAVFALASFTTMTADVPVPCGLISLPLCSGVSVVLWLNFLSPVERSYRLSFENAIYTVFLFQKGSTLVG